MERGIEERKSVLNSVQCRKGFCTQVFEGGSRY